jgi:ferredoxin
MRTSGAPQRNNHHNKEPSVEITVNQALCSGHARCNAAAPDVYSLDEGGYCAIQNIPVARAAERAARDGAEACPERAITLTE